MSDKILIKKVPVHVWECPGCGEIVQERVNPKDCKLVRCSWCRKCFSPDDFGSEILEEGD